MRDRKEARIAIDTKHRIIMRIAKIHHRQPLHRERSEGSVRSIALQNKLNLRKRHACVFVMRARSQLSNHARTHALEEGSRLRVIL